MFVRATRILTIICCLWGANPSRAQQYEIVDLGTLGGGHSGALAISESGIIAGYATTAAGAKHPVIWVDQIIQDLGPPPIFGYGRAVGVNDAGQAAVVADGNPQAYRGFLWSDGNWTELGLLPDRAECIPEDIDGTGRIVGTCLSLGSGNSAAFIWEAGEMNDLGTVSGTARAYGINDLGQVVGSSRANQPGGDGLQRAWLWEEGQMTVLEPLDGRDNSQAFGINDWGDVAGSSWYPTGPYSLSVDRATIWQEGGADILDLGYTPGPPVCSADPRYPDNIALAVNDHGKAVGHAQCITSGGALAAFLWDGTEMHNLNDLVEPGTGWDLIKAWDINNRGEIVGYGIAPGSYPNLRAFLLVPRPTAVEGSQPASQEAVASLSAHPNPFRHSTRLSYSLGRAGVVSLTVHDVLGRRVATLTETFSGEGEHAIVWSGESDAGQRLASGVYMLRLGSGSRIATQRVLLLH